LKQKAFRASTGGTLITPRHAAATLALRGPTDQSNPATNVFNHPTQVSTTNCEVQAHGNNTNGNSSHLNRIVMLLAQLQIQS